MNLKRKLIAQWLGAQNSREKNGTAKMLTKKSNIENSLQQKAFKIYFIILFYFTNTKNFKWLKMVVHKTECRKDRSIKNCRRGLNVATSKTDYIIYFDKANNFIIINAYYQQAIEKN